MRRKALLLAALPAASAISFANFQPMSFGHVPPICESPYYAQIPACTVSDFHNGCSEQCEMALEAMAQGVISACSRFPAPPDSLLNSILAGGIVEAVCPPVESPPPPPEPPMIPPEMSMPSEPTPPPPPPPTSTPQAQPTPPPMAPPPPPPPPPAPAHTSSPPKPVVAPQPTPTLEGVTRVSICGMATETPPALPNPALPNPVETSPAEGGGSPEPQQTESAPPAATTTKAGGAAPFQLVGGNVDEVGAASMLRGSSVLALVVAALACILL